MQQTLPFMEPVKSKFYYEKSMETPHWLGWLPLTGPISPWQYATSRHLRPQDSCPSLVVIQHNPPDHFFKLSSKTMGIWELLYFVCWEGHIWEEVFTDTFSTSLYFPSHSIRTHIIYRPKGKLHIKWIRCMLRNDPMKADR